MGERFVVVPVDGGGGLTGEGEQSDTVVAEPALDTGVGSGGGVDAREVREDTVFGPQDPNAVVPILEYNREPNKYGMADARRKLHAPCIISVL